MIKKLPFFLLLFAFALVNTILYAQQPEKSIDSIIVNKVNTISNDFGNLLTKDLDSAEVMARYMLSYSNEKGYLTGQGKAYGSLGGVYLYRGQNGKAIAYFIKAAEIFESLGSKDNAAVTYSNIGSLFMDQEQFKEAKIYIDKALAIHLKNNEDNVQSSYLALGIIALNTGKSFEEVMELLDKAESIALKDKEKGFLGNIMRIQGKAHIERNQDLPYAISRFNEALDYSTSKKQNNHFEKGNIYLYLGKAHWKMGEFKEALRYNDSSLVHYNALDYFKGLRLTYKNRKDILEGLGDYRSGFEAFKEYSKHNDSTFVKQRENQVARMKIEFETDQAIAEKKTAEIKAALAEEKSIRNSNLLIGAIAISGLILLSSILYFSRLKAKKKAEIIRLELHETQKRLALEKQYRDSELKALKAQMNPHFIFNALNSIQEYIILNKKDLAGDYLGKFADLMRKYLKHSDTGTLSVQDEIESLQMYLELEALRFEDTLNYSFSVSEILNKEQLYIPTMLIQPYVENAIKHGLLHRKTNRKLAVSFIKKTDNAIICIIEDNGVGRKRSEEIRVQNKNMHTSFATKATENRLHLLNYEKDQKIGVEIIDLYDEEGKANGTRVVLNIPITKN